MSFASSSQDGASPHVAFNHGRSGRLQWPHRGRLKWPHFASVVVGSDVDGWPGRMVVPRLSWRRLGGLARTEAVGWDGEPGLLDSISLFRVCTSSLPLGM